MHAWRGLKALLHDAVDTTTALVREGQGSARRAVTRMTAPFEAIAVPVRTIDGALGISSAFTFGAITSVNRALEELTDAILDASAPNDAGKSAPIALCSEALGSGPWAADAALGALNGALGDHLAATHNALDLGLVLRLGDRYLEAHDAPPLAETVVVFIHGLGTTEWCWSFGAQAQYGDSRLNFASMLERDLGSSSLFVRYNTGRRIADSGRALSLALEQALSASQSARVVLVGHSMGGLVARSACHAATIAGHRWLQRVDLLISLGTPHQGAPLARFGQSVAAGLSALDLPAPIVIAQILAKRSAGVRDLEYGDITGRKHGETSPDDLAPLVDGIRYAFLSATVTSDPEDPISGQLGDLLVRVESASGPIYREITPVHTATTGGILHHQIQNHPAIYEQIRELIAIRGSCGAETQQAP